MSNSNPPTPASQGAMNHCFEYRLRMPPPSEPEPFPVKEPPEPPENPDLPIREPDPEDPGQI